MFKILSIKLFGKKYEKIIKSLLICIIVYAGLSGLEQNIPVAHSIIMFINLVFSATIMIQFLGSKDNADYLKGYFAMPFEKKSFVPEYAAAMGTYVLFTKTLLVYSLICAFTKIQPVDILLIITEYIFVCLAAMTAFAYFSDKKYISLAVGALSIAMCFLLPKSPLSAAAYIAAAFLLMLVLFKTDPYRFTATRSDNLKKAKSSGKSGFLIPKYILRYFLSNRSYIVSQVIILVFIGFFTINMKKSGFDKGITMGLALITMNTPLSIIVSSNRGLSAKLDSMPSKFRNFFFPYACFLFVYYIIISAVLITALSFFGIPFSVISAAAAILFSAQASAATAFMEHKKPITNWKVETDLLHHPRKYIVPGILILEGALLAII